MFRHYLRTASRVLSRQASFSAINLFGLSVGVATALLLLLFVQNEVTFDSGHTKADRIHRAWVLEDYGPEQVHFNTTTPFRTGPDLQAAIPEVETFTRFDRFSATVRREAINHNETVYMADPTFLDIFDFEVVRGDQGSMLALPDQVVLTESAAKRYFGDADPLGQVLSIDFDESPRSFEVAGVLADIPENSSVRFEILLSYGITDWFYSDGFKTAFFSVSPETYILLREGAEVADVEAKIPAVITSVIGGRVEEGQYQVGLQPLQDIHMNPDFPQGYSAVIDPAYVQIMLALAALILAIACINFVTLSVSRSLARAKEIGVRKVMGASRTQLMIQYWGEALLLTGISVVLGLVLAKVLLPAFNGLAQRNLALSLSGGTLLLVGSIFTVVGLLAGLYPALVLSRFSPIEAFRGKTGGGDGKSSVRRALVIAQFSLSILMIASTVAIGNQLDFLRTKDLGFNKQSVMVIPTVANTQEGKEIAAQLRFLMAGRSDVTSITSAAMFFDQDGWARIGYTATDGSYRRHFANVVDPEFISTMGLRLLSGRDFDPNQPGDADRAIIINEAFASAQGWTDPFNQTIPGQFDDHEIIGVVEDFHFASLHTEVAPALIVLTPNVAFSGAQDTDYSGSFSPEIAIRISGSDVPATIRAIEKHWAEVAPDMPFTYSFIDDEIARQYVQEARLGDIVALGSLLSILIAGLGLFGLASLSVARRSKEIGLRKVLGASVTGIVGLFTAEFSVLVAIAFVLATPLAWYGTEQWVSGFAYRASVGVSPFMIAGAAALVVMLAAVSLQAVRAAVSNPVDALRDE